MLGGVGRNQEGHHPKPGVRQFVDGFHLRQVGFHFGGLEEADGVGEGLFYGHVFPPGRGHNGGAAARWWLMNPPGVLEVVVFRLVGVVAVGVLVAGCSPSGTPEEEASEGAGVEQSPTPVDPGEVLEWGETVEVVGENGTPVELTPTGIRYVEGDGLDSSVAPDSGVCVAVGVEAEALAGAEGLGYFGAGNGFTWRVGGQETTTMDGEAPVAPWVGVAPDFVQDLLPGEPTVGVETFDSADPGVLVYTDSEGGMVRWEAPGGGVGDVPEVEEWSG